MAHGLLILGPASISNCTYQSRHNTHEGAHCDDFETEFPYVILKASDTGTCGDWDYGSDVIVHEAVGCVDFAGMGGVNLVDVNLDVESPLFKGTVVAGNRSVITPTAVSLGIIYSSDIPEDAYVQTSNDYALPSWVTIAKNGVPILMFDQCDIPVCGVDSGVCGIALHTTYNFTGGDYSGRIFMTWDGKERVYDETLNCRNRVPVAAGDYTATFCYGSQVSESTQGSDVVNPICHEIGFTYPTDKVVYSADVGG